MIIVNPQVEHTELSLNAAPLDASASSIWSSVTIRSRFSRQLNMA